MNILQEHADIPYEQGLWSTPIVNIGEANGQGVDLALDYQQTVNKDFTTKKMCCGGEKFIVFWPLTVLEETSLWYTTE
jgi:hypothetical protein